MQKAGPYTRKKEGKRREMRDEMNPGIRLDDATFGHKPKHKRSHSGTDSTPGISRTEEQAKPNLTEVKQGQRSDKGHTQKETDDEGYRIVTRKRQPRQKVEEIVVVKSDTKRTYAALVKSQVDIEETGANAGEKTDKAEALREAITNKNIEGIHAVAPKKKAVLHIKDLEVDVNEEEIMTALADSLKVSISAMDAKVSSLRPAYGRRKQQSSSLNLQQINSSRWGE
ncbi:hypothetical protein J6590_063401 [Homalodisca vitripennis]|nr:hypothetical protein J6590_063401 [Homalodisca vitripennis]